MGRFTRPAVFAANGSTWKMLKIDLRKMLKIDLRKEKNMIFSSNVHLGIGAAGAINKCTTTQALEVGKFKQNG